MSLVPVSVMMYHRPSTDKCLVRTLSLKLHGRIQNCANHPILAGLDDFFFEVDIVCGGNDR
jgi:hypothetical protein